MNDIREILNRQLGQSDIDVLDIVPVPLNGDRMVRLRTLEEALKDWSDENGENGEDASSFLIQVKPRRGPAPPHKPSAATASATGENIYAGNGKLNIPYLARNAELLLSAGEHTLARNIFKAIQDSGERPDTALYGLARCNETENKWDEARKNYEEAIAYHPTLDGYHRLSALLSRQNKHQVAAEVLERALNLKNLDATTRYDLHKASGNSWTRAGTAASSEAAEKHYRQALEIDPSADEICCNLGALYLQQQKLAEAKRSFEDAIAANPNNDKAQIGIASCHIATGDKRYAHDHFAKALDINLNNPSAIYHLVKCAYEIRSYATAARIVEEYVDVASPDANLLYSLAGLQYHLGRLADARATAQQILSLNAEHSGAKELLKLIESSRSTDGPGLGGMDGR